MAKLDSSELMRIEYLGVERVRCMAIRDTSPPRSSKIKNFRESGKLVRRYSGIAGAGSARSCLGRRGTLHANPTLGVHG